MFKAKIIPTCEVPFEQVFSGCIATKQRLVHPQAAYQLLAKIRFVNGHQPLVTEP